MVWRDARVVFQDIDGCLNTEDSHFPDGAGQSLNAQQAAMLAKIGSAMDECRLSNVVINSGRGFAAMDFIVAGLDSQSVRYVLGEHGATLFDVVKGKPVDLFEMASRHGSPERAKRYAQLKPIQEAIAWYHAEGEAQLSELFGCPLPALPKTANLTLMIPAGIPPKDVLRALKHAVTTNADVDSKDFEYYSSELYIDIISEVKKSDGALLLLEELGIAPEQAIPMGDGENDISMFEALGPGFCPANSASKLKRVCQERSGVISSLSYAEAALEFYRKLAY